MKKKLIVLSIAMGLIGSFLFIDKDDYGLKEGIDISKNKNEISKEVREEESLDYDLIKSLEEINNYQDVDNLFEQNENIFLEHKKIRDLDEGVITKETVFEYAKKAIEIAMENPDFSYRYGTISKLARMDDLGNNTTKDVKQELLNYLIEAWNTKEILDTTNYYKFLEFQYISEYLIEAYYNDSNNQFISQFTFDVNEAINMRKLSDSTLFKTGKPLIIDGEELTNSYLPGLVSHINEKYKKILSK